MNVKLKYGGKEVGSFSELLDKYPHRQFDSHKRIQAVGQ